MIWGWNNSAYSNRKNLSFDTVFPSSLHFSRIMLGRSSIPLLFQSDIIDDIKDDPLMGSFCLDRMENFLFNLKTWKFEFSSQEAQIEFNAIEI